MTSCLHIHIGGAGVKIGESLWKLYAKEQKDVLNKEYVYQELQKGGRARVIFVDVDDHEINQVKKQKIENIYSNQFIVGKQSQGCTYAEGYYNSKDILDMCKEKVRLEIEACDRLESIIFTSSISGGTGSGFLTKLLYTLNLDYQKMKQYAFVLFPSRNMSNTTIDILNAVYAQETLGNSCDATIMFDNESMYKVLESQIDLETVDYSHLNNLISQVISTYTGIQRFNPERNADVIQNLIPYPCTNFLIPSYAPLANVNNYQRQRKSKLQYLISQDAQLYNCQLKPSYLSSALINRGLDYDRYYYESNIALKTLNQYKCQTSLYSCISRNYQIIPELAELPSTETLLTNNSSVYNELKLLRKKFDNFQSRWAFFHHYMQIMDSDQRRAGSRCLKEIEKIYEDEYFKGQNQDDIQEEDEQDEQNQDSDSDSEI